VVFCTKSLIELAFEISSLLLTNFVHWSGQLTDSQFIRPDMEEVKLSLVP